MTQPVRIAVAGAGLIGQAHIKRVLEEPQAALAAIIDPSPKAKEQAQALEVSYYADLEEGLQAAKPDGVVIATPNQLHVPNGLTAVKAGVPMLLEKPVSGDVESALQLVEASEKAGVAILVGHHRRHSPLIQRAREIVESGRLGKLTAVTGLCLFLKPKDYFDGSGAWRREPGGGLVLINLIHGNCSGRSDRLAHVVIGNGVPWSVRRMASMARIALRRAVSTTDRISA